MRCFSSPGLPPATMDSSQDDPCGSGCPIRKPRDQRSLASTPGLSQRAASFIASQCQGIHQMPFFLRLIAKLACRAKPRKRISREDTLHSPEAACARTRPRENRFGYSLFTCQRPPPARLPARTVFVASPDPNQSVSLPQSGGGERNRTADLLLAKQALSQLSYTPAFQADNGWPADGGPGKI
jgi:hypothetical protein